MKQSIRDVMTARPFSLDAEAPVREAARLMRSANVGDVIVTRDDKICGIATDRDIVVRAIAQGSDPETTPIGDVCSQDPISLAPTDSVDEAVRLMRERAIRRLPIVEDGRPVGMISLGDLALARDPSSALADISAAPANR